MPVEDSTVTSPPVALSKAVLPVTDADAPVEVSETAPEADPATVVDVRVSTSLPAALKARLVGPLTLPFTIWTKPPAAAVMLTSEAVEVTLVTPVVAISEASLSPRSVRSVPEDEAVSRTRLPGDPDSKASLP